MNTGPSRGIVDVGIGLRRGADLTINAGAVTLAEGSHAIATADGANTDDLDTINPGVLDDGGLLLLYAASGARTVTVKHKPDEQTPGNIELLSGADYLLDDAVKSLLLRRDGDTFRDIIPQVAGSGYIFIEEQALQAVTQLEFSTLDFTTYNSFKINMACTVSNDVDIHLQFSQGGVFQVGANDYGSHAYPDQIVSNLDTFMRAARNIYKGSSNYNEGATGWIEIFPPIGIASSFRGASLVSAFAHNVGGPGNTHQSRCVGQFQGNANDIDGVRIALSSGTYEDIRCQLWGFRKV